MSVIRDATRQVGKSLFAIGGFFANNHKDEYSEDDLKSIPGYSELLKKIKGLEKEINNVPNNNRVKITKGKNKTEIGIKPTPNLKSNKDNKDLLR